MKRVALVILAAISALICTEWVVSRIIGYPTYGVRMKMLGIRGPGQPPGNIFKPHSRYWTVEGGNRVFRRNNVGLTGIDIAVSSQSKYIFVLGDSFIEANQLPPDRIATSVMQRKLEKSHPEYQVLNLGSPGHDPYDLYWRASFFAKEYPPAQVYLVLEKTNNIELERQRHPFNFDPDFLVPKRVDSFQMRMAMFFLNQSSFFNLISNLFKSNGLNDVMKEGDLSYQDRYVLGDDLVACLRHFKLKYGSRFSLISIVDNPGFNNDLSGYCRENGIGMMVRNGLNEKNRIGGTGHFNLNGNKALGELLHETFMQSGKMQ